MSELYSSVTINNHTVFLPDYYSNSPYFPGLDSNPVVSTHQFFLDGHVLSTLPLQDGVGVIYHNRNNGWRFTVFNPETDSEIAPGVGVLDDAPFSTWPMRSLLYKAFVCKEGNRDRLMMLFAFRVFVKNKERAVVYLLEYMPGDTPQVRNLLFGSVIPEPEGVDYVAYFGVEHSCAAGCDSKGRVYFVLKGFQVTGSCGRRADSATGLFLYRLEPAEMGTPLLSIDNSGKESYRITRVGSYCDNFISGTDCCQLHESDFSLSVVGVYQIFNGPGFCDRTSVCDRNEDNSVLNSLNDQDIFRLRFILEPDMASVLDTDMQWFDLGGGETRVVCKFPWHGCQSDSQCLCKTH